MGYQTNLLFSLAKSLAKTPELIMKVRHEEKQVLLEEIRRLKQDVKGWKIDDEVNELLDMKPGDFRLIEHYKNHPPNKTTYQLDPNSSRLVILAHGLKGKVDVVGQDEGGKISTPITAATLVDWIEALLNGQTVQRISLHICYAGGGNPTVIGNPNPFGMALARKCGDIAKTVSARAGVITMDSSGKRSVNGEYRATGSKIIYTTGANAQAKPYDYSVKIARDNKIWATSEEGNKKWFEQN